MNKRRIWRFGLTALAAGLLGALGIFAEPATRSGQVADADEWTYYFSSGESYCKNCCPGGSSLCCTVPEECKSRA